MKHILQTIPDLRIIDKEPYLFVTISIKDKRGKVGLLNGYRDSLYTWNWNIPNQNGMPLGNYRVRMMVFNEGE